MNLEDQINVILLFKTHLDNIVDKMKSGEMNEKFIARLSDAIINFNTNEKLLSIKTVSDESDADDNSDDSEISIDMSQIKFKDGNSDSETDDSESDSDSQNTENKDKLLDDFLNNRLKLENYHYINKIDMNLVNKFCESSYLY
jgi:hypothetical protein